jgi:predicted RecA/RadA family phage recombinase
MATGYVHGDDLVTVVAPAAKNTGEGVKVGNLFGVAIANAASAANMAIATRGTWAIRKLNGASSSFAQGANVHWDDTNANCTVSATSNLKIGVAVAPAANADVAVQVRLTGAW